MKKIRDFITSPAATLTAFVLAVALLLFSSVGGARAALAYYSETYRTQVQMQDIGVTLVENGANVSWRDYDTNDRDGSWDENIGPLLSKMLKKDEKLKVGARYPEELAVHNSGTISQYVRVSIYKYWLDAEGNKMRDLSPDLIDLHLTNIGGGGWLEDEEASTPERTVLYYSRLLASDETSPLFADSIAIDGMVASKVTQTSETKDGFTTITTNYDYNGVQFCLEAKVDAVQDHNAQDAIWSAWGRRVRVNDNGVLRLVASE